MGIEGLQSTGNDFATSSDFGFGQGTNVSQTSAQGGGLVAQLEQLIGLLQQVLDSLGGSQGSQQGGDKGDIEQTGGPGKHGRGGCQAGDVGDSESNEQVNKLVLQAIQLLVQALLGGQSSSTGDAAAAEASPSMV